MKNKKVILIIISIILIISIIAVVIVVLSGKKNDEGEVEQPINETQLEMEFNQKFNNPQNEYVSTLYHVEATDTGRYKINADIPYTHLSSEIDSEVNKQIHNVFAQKLLEVYNTTRKLYNINHRLCLFG